jgi:hypothetical protein
VAFVTGPAASKLMPEYRAFIVGVDGHFIGFEPLVCADDEAAIERVKRLSTHDAIELWSGLRLVHSSPRPERKAISHEIHQGRMVPKPAR